MERGTGRRAAAAQAAPSGTAERGRRTVVKVCGITRSEDARLAAGAGADWLGFVLKAESPRRIEPERAAEIASQAQPAIAVAVLVAPSPEEALELAGRARALRVQLHRVDCRAWPADFPLPVAFAIPVAADGALHGPLPPADRLAMLDAAHPVLAGGTGQTLPWDTARRVAATRDVLLAGGLDPDNVMDALERVRPFGVDASSRLESRPGIKDPRRVRRFIAEVRRFDERRRSRD